MAEEFPVAGHNHRDILLAIIEQAADDSHRPDRWPDARAFLDDTAPTAPCGRILQAIGRLDPDLESTVRAILLTGDGEI